MEHKIVFETTLSKLDEIIYGNPSGDFASPKWVNELLEEKANVLQEMYDCIEISQEYDERFDDYHLYILGDVINLLNGMKFKYADKRLKDDFIDDEELRERKYRVAVEYADDYSCCCDLKYLSKPVDMDVATAMFRTYVNRYKGTYDVFETGEPPLDKCKSVYIGILSCFQNEDGEWEDDGFVNEEFCIWRRD